LGNPNALSEAFPWTDSYQLREGLIILTKSIYQNNNSANLTIDKRYSFN
jgi:hypothetical protein